MMAIHREPINHPLGGCVSVLFFLPMDGFDEQLPRLLTCGGCVFVFINQGWEKNIPAAGTMPLLTA